MGVHAVMGMRRVGGGSSFPNDGASADPETAPPAIAAGSAAAMLSLPKKKSGLFGASSNLINSIVGAGIVGIPYAFRMSGFVAGLFLLGLVAFLTDRSLRVIINLAAFHPKLKKRNVWTYEELASYPFGKVGKAFVLVNMFVMAYGASKFCELCKAAQLVVVSSTYGSVVCASNISPIAISSLYSPSGGVSYYHQGYSPNRPRDGRWSKA